MSRVHDPKAELILALPPIALSELREPTKDYLLAKANHGHTPLETLKQLLDRGAEREGFRQSGQGVGGGGKTSGQGSGARGQGKESGPSAARPDQLLDSP